MRYDTRGAPGFSLGSRDCAASRRVHPNRALRVHVNHRGLFAMAIALATTACAAGPDAAGTDAAEVVTIDPDFTIGLVDGDSAYLFGAIVSVAADDDGRLYVGDRIGATIRAYDGDGRYLKQIARAGEGPGEIYGWPADVTMGPEGRLFVRDGTRITVFTPAMAGDVADSVATIWRLPGYGNLSSTRSRVSMTGEYYYPGYLFMDGQLPRFFYLPFDNTGLTGDTVELPAYPSLTGRRGASYRVSERSGRSLDGLSHVPFAPLPVWDITHSGTILSTDGSRYEIVETNGAGDTLRVITGEWKPQVIPSAEKADSARALGARLDTLPVPIDRVINLGDGVRDRRLPETLPAIIGIHIATDGRIWVERWPSEGQSDSRFYDVLNTDGVLIERIVLRAPLTRDPPPFFGARHVVGVLRDADTGVERVIRFTVRRITSSAEGPGS